MRALRVLGGWALFALVLYAGIEWAFRIDAYELQQQMKRHAQMRAGQ